ncbi:MAG: nucleotidyltransferase domain-containing protein [Actinomycetota bacterium]|nr:nucleotidyltransferase domain-containing protein [Actinomycetota bacterium]
MTTARGALQRLVELTEDGALDDFLRDHGVELLTAFGSATRTGGVAADLDLAVALAPQADLYGLVADLIGLLGFDNIDVVDLATADVVLAAEALGVCLPIFEAERGLYARRQMAALTEKMETAYLRRLDLRLLSS